MKRLGLIGGIGTLAGVNLVWRMVDQCAKDGAREDSEFPDFVYVNVPTSDTTATGSIPIDSQREIMRAFDKLEMLNCDIALILCNTAHFLFDEFSKWFSGDIVNMVEIAASKAIGRVAVLQSRMASDHLLYEKPLLERKCSILKLTEAQQKVIDGLISECMGGGTEEATIKFHELQADICQKGAEEIIIGCTELSMIPRHNTTSWKVIDSGSVAIEEALRLCR